MKTKLISALILLFLGVNGFGQVEIQWQKCFGGTNLEEATSIKMTNDGGFIIAGNTTSNNGDVSGFHGPPGYEDIWVVKSDCQGNIQWQRCFGGTGQDNACSIIQLTCGDYILFGRTSSNNGDVSGNHGSLDFWVVRLNFEGNILWQKCIGGSGEEFGQCMQLTIDGGFILAGYSTSNDGNVSGNHGSTDMWIVKFDAQGSLQWQKCLGGTALESANSIQQTNDGGYIVSGATNSNNGDVSGFLGGTDMWLVKLDPQGNITWQKCLGGSDSESAYTVLQTNDCGYLIAGDTFSNNGNVTWNHGAGDMWIIKTDFLGNIEWQNCYGGSGLEMLKRIIPVHDGDFVLAGATESNNGDVSGINGSYDMWVLRINHTGNIVWQICLGGALGEEALDIIQFTDKGFLVAGNAQSNNGDVSGVHGGLDFWIVKLIEPNLSGTVFHDTNLNGYKDPGEQGIAGHLVGLAPGNEYLYTNNEGYYYFFGDTGITHTIEYLPQLYWYETTGNYQYNVLLDSLSQRVDTLDYGIKCRLNVNDVSVYISGSPTRANFDTHYWLTYKNWGTVTANGTIEFQYDPLLTYLASTPLLPVSHVGNTLTFAYDTLGPGAQRTLRLDFQVPGVQYLGDTLHSYAMITPLVPDTFITNNYDTLDQVITGSYDPNDKSVRPEGYGTDGYVLHGERLTYTIRFQNTGTDTAFTVVIRDTLDADLDIETFLVEAYSHPVTWQLHNGNELHFTYQNINLPDSNVNEPGSHGFIRYSISPKTGLADFTQVFNTAYIFFDYNPAIVTNTELNTYVSTLTETASVTAAETVKAYPNPTSQTIYINLPEFTRKIEVYNTSGEKVKELVPQKEVAEIGVKDLPAGLYVVRMYGANGVVTTKFVRE